MIDGAVYNDVADVLCAQFLSLRGAREKCINFSVEEQSFGGTDSLASIQWISFSGSNPTYATRIFSKRLDV